MDNPPRRSRSTLFKTRAALVAAALAVLLAAYAAGRLQTRYRLSAIQDRTAEVVNGLNAELEGMRSRLEVADRERMQLEARRQMSLALQALDMRNFGTAQQHLREASDKLRRSSVENTEAAKLGQDVGALTLSASDDVSRSREKVSELAARFDREVAPEMTIEK